jgi:hypothetical protein
MLVEEHVNQLVHPIMELEVLVAEELQQLEVE